MKKKYALLLFYGSVLFSCASLSEHNRQQETQGISLYLVLSQETYHVGENIEMTLMVKNDSNAPIYIDTGSLEVHYRINDSEGPAVEAVPISDIFRTMPGAEGFEKIDVRGMFRQQEILRINNKKWIGFGLPGGAYQGVALKAKHPDREELFIMERIPAVYSLSVSWTFPAIAAERAKKYSIPASFVGTITSNSVSFSLEP